MEIILKVEGMSCSHCEKAVSDAVLKLSGVTEVVISLSEKTVKVLGENLNKALIETTIDNQGYEVVS